MTDIEQDDTEESGPSKSQLKRESADLRDLGEKLTTLPDSILERCALPEALSDAIASYKSMPNKHGSRRRQLQFIGKVMRDMPESVLLQINAQLNQNVDLDKKRFHELELLRDSLVSGDKDVLDKVITAHPDINIQQLRQLIRQAQKEIEEKQTPASARKLFQLLRDLQE